MTAADRLAAQVGFVLEADRLKSVLRRGYVADGSRVENSAEHSWTLALMAIVLAEHAAEPVDLSTVVRMVVIHDIVEVDAGDTYIYDDAGTADQEAREQRAADRLFGLLPPAQAAELRSLWDEFEEAVSPEARFARALDRFAGFLLNHASGGLSWREHGITADQVHRRNQVIDTGAPPLWDEVRRRLADAVADGWIDPGDSDAGVAGAGAAGAAAAASGVAHQHHGTSETPEPAADG
jgi:putative hydrolases of HD superfamily